MQEIIAQLERLFTEMVYPDRTMMVTLISSSGMYLAIAVAAAVVLYVLHDLIVSASIPTLVVAVTDGKHWAPLKCCDLHANGHMPVCLTKCCW